MIPVVDLFAGAGGFGIASRIVGADLRLSVEIDHRACETLRLNDTDDRHPNPTFEAESRFWNFLLKLHPEKQSWTVAASPGPWTGPFHWETRRLRTPELAAIQSFPEGYRFAGSRRDRVKQIGNAVPPKMAAAVIAKVLEAIGCCGSKR